MRRFSRCRRVTLRAPDGRTVEAVRADRPLARLLGLALLRRPPATALLLPRCRSVHTWGMGFPLDVVFLASAGGDGIGGEALRVVGVERGVGARRVVSARTPGELLALELPSEEAPQSTSGATAAGAGCTSTR